MTDQLKNVQNVTFELTYEWSDGSTGKFLTVGELTKKHLRHPNEKLADLRLGKQKWGRR